MTTVVPSPSPTLERAEAWGSRSDISARSVLVTILGDTVEPLGSSMWLSHLIALAEPFGFNERLVRTSMFRLVNENWVTNERIGRQSRYAITPHGLDETRAAERRIYGSLERPWDGTWTLILAGEAGLSSDPVLAADLARRLLWRGFAHARAGVLVRPNDMVAETRRLFDRMGVEPPPAVASARFDDRSPVTRAAFRAESGLADAEAAFHRFVERYRDLADEVESAIGRSGLAPVDAFALRTMVVHDLRRARLRDPELPPALLPDDWIGGQAHALAGRLYRAVTADAWAWVTEVTGEPIDPHCPRLRQRFATQPTGETP